MKTANKCPRCGSPSHESPWADDTETWHCGTYRAPSGHLYESELCETRQELKIQRGIATQFEAGAALLILRAEKAEAELANREKALEQARRVASLDLSADNSGICVGSKSYLGWGPADANPELAEWLKGRSV